MSAWEDWDTQHRGPSDFVLGLIVAAVMLVILQFAL
jgi:hypothetical protein